MSRSTTITGDALQVQRLLAWARREGIVLNRITVGGCTVDVAPEAERPSRAPRKPQLAPERPNIYSMHGGEMLQQARESGDLEGELMPVVGRK